MASSMSEFFENFCLENLVGKKPTGAAKCFASLLTAVPTAATKGTELAEATYTGYEKFEIPIAEWVASGNNPRVYKNKEAIKWKERTAGSDKIVAVALTDNATAKTGNALCWTEVTEFEVSATNKKPEVAVEALELKLK